jgi:omega-amidase
MTSSRELVSLSFTTFHNEYEQNLQKLISLILQTPKNSIIVAHEVCLSNFDYENFEKAADFTPYAIEQVLKILDNRALIFSAITKKEDGIYNVSYLLNREKIIHTQAKTKLFKLGDEHKYFREASEDEIKIVEIDGVKIAILICFELRFKKLWQLIEGADIVAITAQWGKIRSEHFVTLCKSLAIMNQCFVIACDANNSDTTGISSITTPFGDQKFFENEILKLHYDSGEIKKMRKYLDVGIR